MSITWKIPGNQPDPAAIARMRQHFPKPDVLMPVAWFMGEIEFYESLAIESPQTLNAKEICRALDDIAGGIFGFPEVEYVPVWIAWFKYLLPDLLLRATPPETPVPYDWILVSTIIAAFNVYPQQIIEEYAGFRDDLVSTLATRAIPPKLAYEKHASGDERSPLFVDIWDTSLIIEYHGFESLEEVDRLILFCLKYLTVAEISEWAASLFHVDSPQWHLQMILSLTEWRRFQNLALDWNKDEKHFLRRILQESGLLQEFWIPNYKSLDEFLPAANIAAFEESISAHFSFDLFHTWTDDIWRLLDTAPYNVKNGRYLNHYMAKDLRDCEAVLFPQGRGNSVVLAYDGSI